MSNLRCFDTYNAIKFTSSDYTTNVKRRTLFKNAQTLAIGNASFQKGISANSIPPGYPIKKTGGRYFDPVYVSPNTASQQNGCLISARSYESLYDVLKGKHSTLNTFDLDNLLTVNGSAWVGTFSAINYDQKNINCAITNLPNGSCNVMNYEARQDYPPTGGLATFPGMIVDPSYEVFYPLCPSKGNNYNKNITFIFNIIAETQPEILKYLSVKSFTAVDQFPFPLNFNNTTCDPTK
jgi:hypothetical protein